MKIAHIINPVLVNEDHPSYLYYTQPITFQSMFDSKIYSQNKNNNLSIELYSINYPEDNIIIPDYFIKLPFLINSTQIEYPNITNKKYPFLQDIFDYSLKYINADYYIFSNADIIVHFNFYNFIYKKIIKYNYDSLIINRRDNIPKFINNIRLTKDHLNLIFELNGENHPGRDCFIIHHDILQKIDMKKLFIARPPWGLILMNYLNKISKNFKFFKNEFITFHLGCDNNHNNSNKKEILTKLNYSNSKSVYN